MVEFLSALVVFALAHMVPARPSIRARLTGTLGEGLYLALYVAVSLVLMIWVISAAGRAPAVFLWTAPAWTFWLPVVVMPVALILVAAGLLEPNPLSVSVNRQAFDARRPGIVGLTRHPVLWGFGLWGLSHIPVNGLLVHFILFGGVTLLSFMGMRIVDKKRQRVLGGETWYQLESGRRARTLSRILTTRTLAGVVVGLALTGFFLLYAHQAWIGVSPVIAL